MVDDKEMYFKMFNEISKIIESLQEVQYELEEMYIECEDTGFKILDIPKSK